VVLDAPFANVVSEAVPKQLARSNATEGEPPVGDGDYCNQDAGDYYSTVFVQCVNLHENSAPMQKLVLDKDLARAVADTAGEAGKLRLYHDHYLEKPAWGSATNLHHDNQLDPWWTNASHMLWIALDDTTMQNGALLFLLGTHKQAVYQKTEMHGGFGGDNTIGGLLRRRPEWSAIEPVVVAARAGDAILINGMVAHGAGPNLTPRKRRVASVLYVGDVENLTFSPSSPGALHS